MPTKETDSSPTFSFLPQFYDIFLNNFKNVIELAESEILNDGIESRRRQIKSVKMAELIIPRKLLRKLQRNTILVLAQSSAPQTSSYPQLWNARQVSFLQLLEVNVVVQIKGLFPAVAPKLLDILSPHASSE